MKGRKITAMVLAVCAMAFMAACGSSAAETTAPETTAAGSGETTAAAEAGESDIAYIKDKGVLVVGITDFEPMDYHDADGSWIGFDADMARKVADSLGVKAEFVEIAWDNKILELDNKSIDVVWNGMTLTKEVSEKMACTNAYCSNYQVVVLPADKAGQYTTLDSLKGLNVAVEAGSAGESAAKAAGLNVTALNAQSDALMEVAADTSDACVIDLMMAQAMTGEGTSYPDLVYGLEVGESEQYVVGCRVGSDLCPYINEQIAALYADGTAAALGEQYNIADNLIQQ